ncbi:type I restriction enzyme, S subunit [Candidatus Methanophagaceae archaeon]|nr:type I restriction enzyme, S subunit [Methanophagales archaeon]
MDNGIANLKNAQEQLKIYRQAVLKKAFEGELTRKWREEQTDLPSAEELLLQIKEEREKQYQKQLDEWKKAVKEWEDNGKDGKKPSRPKKPKELPPLSEEALKELPELPVGWCWERLGLIANKIQIGPFGSQLHKCDYRKEGVPIINPKHIRGQNLNPKERISKGKADSLSQYYLQENDIILGRRGEMGRSAPITSKTNGWFCGTGSLYIRLGQHFKSKLYSLILSEKRVVDYLENQSRGTTMTNLNLQILHSLPIQLIPIAEQSKIVREIETRLSVCDKLEATIAESMQKAEALRQSILKRAFEGELLNETELEEARNAPDWEPADKLLERIKVEKEKQGTKKSFWGTPSE